jgi:serine/threonine-protein kinase
MPYEQAVKAKNADGRSDIYALGATFYHLLTGKVPFPGDNHIDVVAMKNQGEYPAASSLNADVPASLDPIVDRMLARLQRDRYQTVSELIIDLERTHLAAVVPSFADPEQVRQDPWVQARLSNDNMPTRLDPESPTHRAEEAWVLRYRNREGGLRKAKGTTTQIVERLQDGRLPSFVQISRPGQFDFHPPSHYPEFQSATRTGRSRRKGRRADPSQPPSAPDSGAPVSNTRGLPVVLLTIGALAAVFGLLALAYRFFWMPG